MTTSTTGTLKTLLIIVTYNSFAQLPDLQTTIHEFVGSGAGNYVAVIENSGDARVEEFLEAVATPHRLLVEVSPANDGFSHGVNRGYSAAQRRWGTFDFVVLLNPDVSSAGRTVSELAKRAQDSEQNVTGVWGVVLRNALGEVDRGCARRLWNRRRFFSSLLGYDNLATVLCTAPRNLSQREIAYDRSDLAMVSGALMCIRTALLADGLNTVLPMYLEDQEICLRSIRRGLKVSLYPDLSALHSGGLSRKSLSEHDRALRIMELVEAPVQCMVRLQGYSLFPLRLIVFLGGLSRIVAAALGATTKVLWTRTNVKEITSWTLNQQRLGSWFISWSIRGTFHDRPVSLDEYFELYGRTR